MLVSNQPSTQNIVTIVTLLAKYRRKKARLIACLCKVTKPHHYRKRVTWEAFLQDMLLEEDFETTTRMPSLHAFYELCNLLSPFLSSSKRSYVSIKRNISLEFKVYLTLRLLAGGDVLDIHKTIGISKYSVYRYFKKTIEAINMHPALSIDLPTGESLKEIHKGFAKLSGDFDIEDCVTRPTPMKGCVGALDGYLALMDTPVCPGSSDYYFSGHYFHHGLNVQAMCDHKCKFTYFNVVAPGKCPDSIALQKCCDLLEWLTNLPTGSNDGDCFFVVADAANICNSKVLTPFKGPQKAIEENDSYNFFLSQLRIRIEQSFGLLSNKWRIFRAPLGSDIGRAIRILHCCARLHNYVIDRRPVIDNNDNFNRDDEIEALFVQGSVELGYIPSDVEEASQDVRRQDEYDPSLRAQIVSNRILPGNWSRPNYNIARNSNN